MAENNNTTAERELLKTIEGNPALTKKVRTFEVGLIVARLQSAITGVLALAKKTAGGGEKKISLQLINKILIFLVAVVLVFSGLTVFAGATRLGSIPRFDVSKFQPAAGNEETVALPVKTLSYYADIILGRNIFIPYAEEVKQAAPAQNGVQLTQMIENLQVVGISWTGKQGQDEKQGERFAMVEDLKSQLTYFLSEGDTVLQMTVKKIKDESVILEYEGQEIELR